MLKIVSQYISLSILEYQFLANKLLYLNNITMQDRI